MRPLAARMSRLVLLCACAVALCGQGRSPVLNTEADDTRVGKEEAMKVAASIGLLDDPALTEYVNEIGERLQKYAIGSNFDYKFAIVDQQEPNAFALPGGYIFVSRALMALANDEAELASVMGHEIIHVSRRHAAARQLATKNVPTIAQWMQMSSLAAYGRGQESEADKLGQEVAGKAGYDPAALASFLKQLEFSTRLVVGASRIPHFLDTHPGTTGRAGNAADRAQRIAWTPQDEFAKGHEGYLEKIDGLIVDQNPEQGVFVGDRFMHPDLGFHMRFPDGWPVRNMPAAVAAISPQSDAQIVFEFQGRGDDPEAGAAEYFQREGLAVNAQQSMPVKLGKLEGYRVIGSAATPQGNLDVVITWIAFNGTIYRISGITRSRALSRYQGVFINCARSFKPLTPALRKRIRVNRLRSARALEGETLTAFNERTKNEWNIEETAVMNAIFSDQPLKGGQLLKIAHSEPYKGKPQPQ